jgi:hypothetical protein
MRPSEPENIVTGTNAFNELISEMLGNNLIISTQASQHPPCQSALPDSDIWDENEIALVRRFSWNQFFKFLDSVTFGWWQLKRSTLKKTIEHAQNIKKQRRPSKIKTTLSQVQAHMSYFQTLRPLIYTNKDACLFDSLVLFHFLHTSQIDCDLVIGVTTKPFQAHSWIQWNSTVLNDSLEHVQHYKPIFSV